MTISEGPFFEGFCEFFCMDSIVVITLGSGNR